MRQALLDIPGERAIPDRQPVVQGPKSAADRGDGVVAGQAGGD